MPKFVNACTSPLALVIEGVYQEVAPGGTVDVSDSVAADLGTQPQYWQPLLAGKSTPVTDAAVAV
jgi:hypothetical protein